MNPVWHVHNGNIPKENNIMSFSMLLNLVETSNADSKEFFLGNFELNFYAGEYLKSNTKNFSNIQGLLYDIIPIRFSIFSNRNYHIPLLLSPFGYSTYLGS